MRYIVHFTCTPVETLHKTGLLFSFVCLFALHAHLHSWVHTMRSVKNADMVKVLLSCDVTTTVLVK